eukprot:3749251-Amphidinium_carterae.1
MCANEYANLQATCCSSETDLVMTKRIHVTRHGVKRLFDIRDGVAEHNNISKVARLVAEHNRTLLSGLQNVNGHFIPRSFNISTE